MEIRGKLSLMRSLDDERAVRLASGGIVDQNELARILARYASTRPEIEVIWLFGSQAEGTSRRTSDVDLAFQVVRPPAPEDEIGYRAARAREDEALVGFPVDVALLSSRLPVPLLWNVLRVPTVLYEKEPGQAATTGAFLRGLCRDEWPRTDRRWERAQQKLKGWSRHAANIP